MRFCGNPNCGEYWIECARCGCEFCSFCFPDSPLCPDCAEESEPEDETTPDFEDVPNLSAVLAGGATPEAGRADE